MHKTSVGEIVFTRTSNIVTAIIKMKPIFFITFSQTVTTILDEKNYPMKETLNTTVNKKNTIEHMEFQIGKITYTEKASKKTNIKSLSTQTLALSVNSMINRFISDKILQNNTYSVFMVDKLVTITFAQTSPRKKLIKSSDDRFEIETTYYKHKTLNIPQKIQLKKYMLYGINWNIFNLTLKENRTILP